MSQYTVLELCAGGGGQALGLEMAGFQHVAAIEIDATACETLRTNRPYWNIIEGDIADIDGKPFKGVDMIAGGLPCPPFSIAGKQLGSQDDRDLFPHAIRLIQQIMPKMIMIENVPGFASSKFADYRNLIIDRLARLGYVTLWTILSAEQYGVPQIRRRFVMVAFQSRLGAAFEWPSPRMSSMTVSKAIGDLMEARGWRGIDRWRKQADRIAPTLVGGSKKHGGPDLGPTRAKKQWDLLGVDGRGLASLAPDEDFPTDGKPRLTVNMTGRIQAFPDSWVFSGKKTSAYRQIGNAFPPPVAHAVGEAILSALMNRSRQVPNLSPQIHQLMLFPNE